MPQIILEYSTNNAAEPDYAVLFGEIHQLLHTVAGIRLENCKSRARLAEDFFIGDGNASNAFVHLQIRIIEGRSSEIKKAIGEKCLALLKRAYAKSVEALELQITVEVDDLIRDFYFKYPEGSLTPQ